MKDDEEILELVASLEHEQWMAWTKLLVKDGKVSDDIALSWQKEWVSYHDLSERGKDAHREWAGFVLEVVKAAKQENLIMKVECGAKDPDETTKAQCWHEMKIDKQCVEHGVFHTWWSCSNCENIVKIQSGREQMFTTEKTNGVKP